jgi:hypothetical protein
MQYVQLAIVVHYLVGMTLCSVAELQLAIVIREPT